MKKFAVNIIHRPELSPEYAEKALGGAKGVQDESLEIFKFQHSRAVRVIPQKITNSGRRISSPNTPPAFWISMISVVKRGEGGTPQIKSIPPSQIQAARGMVLNIPLMYRYSLVP